MERLPRVVSTHSNDVWLHRWSGSYTFVSCSHWGPEYYGSLQRVLGAGFHRSFMTHSHGTVAFYVPDAELSRFGKAMAARVIREPQLVGRLARVTMRNTDTLLRLMKHLSRHVPTQGEYWQFRQYFDPHLAYHGFIKETIDYLPPAVLQRHAAAFQKARVYSEPVYSASEVFFRKIAAHIGRREGYAPELPTCLTKGELEQYLAGNGLPPRSVLQRRYRGAGLYYEKDVQTILSGNLSTKFESAITSVQLRTRVIHGMTAYAGTVTGRCRVLHNPRDARQLKSGEILVTGMTRPEFLPAFKRAAAVITDAGGFLSHAAITAREVQKPCVVGTQIATRVLRTGMTVAVNAGAGTVRIVR